MNQNELNRDDLKLFLAVPRTGVLSVTGKSAPTLGRRLFALEASTEKERFQRLARGCKLTEHGAHCSTG